MRSAVAALVCLGLAGTAHAERDFCARGGTYRGKAIDFDMREADLHDVYRMLADVGSVNIVIADTVRGKVTMRLRRVPWDQVACTVAAVHGLAIDADGDVLLVRPKPRPPAAHRAPLRPDR